MAGERKSSKKVRNLCVFEKNYYHVTFYSIIFVDLSNSH